MYQLATELNTTLSGTVADRLFSDFGRRIYFPKGIVAQTAEANQRATRFNATVGMAFEEGEPLRLPMMAEHLPKLSARQSVAYAPTAGVPALRELWRDEIVKKNPSLASATISTPAVTPGLTGGLLQAADLFVDEGDTVIVPNMFWGNYRLLLTERRKANLATFEYFDRTGGFNLDAFRKAVEEQASSGAVRLLLNFPNNPTGYTPTTEELRGINEILVEAAENGAAVLVMSDDAYFGLVYEEGVAEESPFAALADAHENLLACKIDGATKEDFAWGFRIGFVTFASKGLSRDHLAALEKKLMGSLRSSISNSNNLGQHLLLDVLNSDQYAAEKARFRGILKERYHEIRRILEQRREGKGPAGSALTELPFNSGYFMSFAVDGLSAEKLRQRLLDQGIGTIAIGDDYLRVAYSTVDQGYLEPLYRAIFETADAMD